MPGEAGAGWGERRGDFFWSASRTAVLEAQGCSLQRWWAFAAPVTTGPQPAGFGILPDTTTSQTAGPKAAPLLRQGIRSPAPRNLIPGGLRRVAVRSTHRPGGPELLVRTVGRSPVRPVIPDAAPRLGFGVGIALCRAPLVELSKTGSPKAVCSSRLPDTSSRQSPGRSRAVTFGHCPSLKSLPGPPPLACGTAPASSPLW